MGNSDSRTIFRDQIQILVNETITQDRFDFWDMLFSIPITLSDVYSMIPDADIQSLLQNRKENLIHLYEYCLSVLEDILIAVDLKSPKISAASNATKILVRIIPFLYSDPDFMWNSDKRCIKLVKLCLKLLFVPGYTLSDKTQSDISIEWNCVDPSRLWESGLAQAEQSGFTSDQIWNNRQDVLKVLLTLNTYDLYREYSKPCQNFAGLLISSKANELVTQLLYSILNLIISSKPLGSWKLPYSSYFSIESQDHTIQAGLQVLALLTYMKFPNFEDVSCLSRNEIPIEALQDNVITQKTAQISDQIELERMYLGLKELIQIKIISQNTYLPGSVKEISYQSEVLVLFWVLIKHNSHFQQFLAAREDVYELIPAITDALSSPDFLIASVSTYILLFFSTQRAISSSLFRQFPNLSTDLPLFSGSYSDFLIISLSRLVYSSVTVYYKPLYCYFLMIICNLSPYIRSLCPLASNSLVRLLEKYSTKVALFESENSHYLLFYTLEAINNIVGYQWNAAAGLILALIRKKDAVGKIFTLSSRWEDRKSDEPEWRTKEWFSSWVNRLPIATIVGVFNFFIPELEKFSKNNSNVTDEGITNFILMNTVVGIIPPPSNVVIRNLEMNLNSEYFEYVYLWTFIYLRSGYHEIVPKEKIQLFRFA